MSYKSDLEAGLEEDSFENLVTFYKDELMKVLNGFEVTRVFTEGERNKLRNVVILTYFNKTWAISERAQALLNE